MSLRQAYSRARKIFPLKAKLRAENKMQRKKTFLHAVKLQLCRRFFV